MKYVTPESSVYVGWTDILPESWGGEFELPEETIAP